MFRNIQGVLATYILVFAKFPAHLQPINGGPKAPNRQKSKNINTTRRVAPHSGGRHTPLPRAEGWAWIKNKK